MSEIGGSGLILLLAVLSVSLWTVRVALAARGRRVAGAAVAAVEATTFVVAFRQLAVDLAAPGRLFAYGVGVAGGTLLGLAIDSRVSRGQSEIRLFVSGTGRVAQELHARGWPATANGATGPAGPVTVVVVVVEDACLPSVLDDIHDVAPEGFYSVHPLRRVRPAPRPAGLPQVRTSGG